LDGRFHWRRDEDQGWKYSGALQSLQKLVVASSRCELKCSFFLADAMFLSSDIFKWLVRSVRWRKMHKNVKNYDFNLLILLCASFLNFGSSRKHEFLQPLCNRPSPNTFHLTLRLISGFAGYFWSLSKYVFFLS
jgi:hypothetical protein